MEIFTKWIDKKHNFGITETKDVYCLLTKIKLKPEIHMGQIVYRRKGSNRRVSRNQINKNAINEEQIIKYDYPF